jgi:dTDP-4-dehydrorhamnose reductase
MKIIGTGLNGLVGSRITELLENYEFENVSRSTGVDITNKDQVFSALRKSSAGIVLHLAAYTKVDEAENQKDLGDKSEVWRINVDGTKNILEACESLNKKIVYFSTDMVFPGNKDLPGKYSEDDGTGAVGFYAKTKEEAEKLVEKATCPWVILRVAYPFRANFEKKEYVRIFKERLEKGMEITTVSDHYFTPTFIDDIAKAVNLIITKDIAGKLHATGEETVSPYDVALKVAETFGLNKDLIHETTREEYFKGKAPRAYNISLNNDKIQGLGLRMHSFSQAILEIKNQLKI